MKVEITKLKYERNYLILLVSVLVIFMMLVAAGYSLLTDHAWYTKIHFLFPGIIGGAIGGMVGSRKIRIRLTEISKFNEFEELFIEYMSKNFRQQSEILEENRTTYKPPRWDLRLFDNWMGQELISVKKAGEGYEIAGPKHSLDRIEAYVRFNKEIIKTH